MNRRAIVVRGVAAREEERFQSVMAAHHELGALPKIGHTLWSVASCKGEWLARLSCSAAAWKCAARDAWIGWDFRHHYDRLHLIANNSRFLILPAQQVANLASRVLALSERRLVRDWRERFGYPVLSLETLVDPQRFHGTIYRAANWRAIGDRRGYRRTRGGYSVEPDSAKRVFVRPLHATAQACLSRPVLDLQYRHGAPKIMLSAEQMRSLPAFFADIPDPRRGQGRRHPRPAVLAVATAATPCGMRGDNAISLWAQDLGQKARARFHCCYRNRRYDVPSRTVIREVLTRVDPDALERALQRWNLQHVEADEGLAIDGKTLCNAIDADERQVHMLSVVGHQSQACHSQKSRLPAHDRQLPLSPTVPPSADRLERIRREFNPAAADFGNLPVYARNLAQSPARPGAKPCRTRTRMKGVGARVISFTRTRDLPWRRAGRRRAAPRTYSQESKQ